MGPSHYHTHLSTQNHISFRMRKCCALKGTPQPKKHASLLITVKVFYICTTCNAQDHLQRSVSLFCSCAEQLGVSEFTFIRVRDGYYFMFYFMIIYFFNVEAGTLKDVS